MKVPKGKTVYYGGKKIKAGSEISDSAAELVGLKKPDAAGGSGGSGAGRGSGGSGGGGKPGDK